jgi:hypothetical protein
MEYSKGVRNVETNMEHRLLGDVDSENFNSLIYVYFEAMNNIPLNSRMINLSRYVFRSPLNHCSVVICSNCLRDTLNTINRSLKKLMKTSYNAKQYKVNENDKEKELHLIPCR